MKAAAEEAAAAPCELLKLEFVRFTGTVAEEIVMLWWCMCWLAAEVEAEGFVLMMTVVLCSWPFDLTGREETDPPDGAAAKTDGS